MQSTTRLQVLGDPVRTAYDKLRSGYRANPFPSLAERRDWLQRLERMLVQRREDFVDAINTDFGGRCRAETLLADVLTTLETVRAARKHVSTWIKPKRVAASLYFIPSKAYVEAVPKGVVAVISPWNYPVNLALAPLAAALAAGNRALLKPSELTPRTSALLGEALRETFTAEEVAVVEGGPDVARAVTQLPLDHLLFTGSTGVGTQVALAAAQNLVPVTLELGGKSPAVVHPDYPMARAAERIALGKLFNAGQTCIAPDYALISEGREEEFLQVFRATVQRCYPGLANGPEYTSMASAKGYDRMRALLEDAKAKGARIEAVSPDGEPSKESRKVAPVVVFGVTDSMRIMQEEIFGPILPVKTFRAVEEAVDYVNAHPRPLALYYFDQDAGRAEETLRRTPSGGACINDTLVHFAQEELPFGGVGGSGQGAYHGVAGFETFSHSRSVLVASSLSVARRIQSPPYGQLLERAVGFIIDGIEGIRGRR